MNIFENQKDRPMLIGKESINPWGTENILNTQFIMNNTRSYKPMIEIPKDKIKTWAFTFLGIFVFYFLIFGITPNIAVSIFSIIGTVMTSLTLSTTLFLFYPIKSKYHKIQAIKNSVNEINTKKIEDGQLLAVSGQLYPEGEEYTESPITKQQCLLYSYFVFENNTIPFANQKLKNMYCFGIRMKPLKISSSYGSFRIISLPELIGFEEKTFNPSNENQTYYSNIYTYLQGNQPTRPQGLPSLQNLTFSSIRDFINNAEGDIKIDLKVQHLEDNFQSKILLEQIVPKGQTVSIVGYWSSAKNGIVKGNDGLTAVSIYRGEFQELLNKLNNEFYLDVIKTTFKFLLYNIPTLAATFILYLIRFSSN